MTFADQSYTKLQLTVYSGDVDLSELDILKQQKVSISSFLHIQAGIIGASHFIKIQYRDRYFTEVFACSKIKETYCPKLYYAPFEKLRSLKIKDSSILSYQFNYQFCQFREQDRINQNLAQRIALLSSKGILLSFTFPAIFESSFTPRTVVVADVQEDIPAIRTFTIHEYPNEDVIVTNESFFVMQPA